LREGEKRDELFYRRLLERRSVELESATARDGESADLLRISAKKCDEAARSEDVSLKQLRLISRSVGLQLQAARLKRRTPLRNGGPKRKKLRHTDSPPPDMVLNDIMTVTEVAAHLRLCRLTIYRLISEGTLRPFKIGRAWRFDRSHVIDASKDKSKLPVGRLGRKRRKAARLRGR